VGGKKRQRRMLVVRVVAMHKPFISADNKPVPTLQIFIFICLDNLYRLPDLTYALVNIPPKVQVGV
jgi:hypothetical protein